MEGARADSLFSFQYCLDSWIILAPFPIDGLDIA